MDCVSERRTGRIGSVRFRGVKGFVTDKVAGFLTNPDTLLGSGFGDFEARSLGGLVGSEVGVLGSSTKNESVLKNNKKGSKKVLQT